MDLRWRTLSCQQLNGLHDDRTKAPKPTEPVREETVGFGRGRCKRNRPKTFTFDRDGVASHLQFTQGVAEMSDHRSAQAHVAHWTMLSVDPENGSLDSFQPVHMRLFKAL